MRFYGHESRNHHRSISTMPHDQYFAKPPLLYVLAICCSVAAKNPVPLFASGCVHFAKSS
jgi:hypothetical protein